LPAPATLRRPTAPLRTAPCHAPQAAVLVSLAPPIVFSLALPIDLSLAPPILFSFPPPIVL